MTCAVQDNYARFLFLVCIESKLEVYIFLVFSNVYNLEAMFLVVTEVKLDKNNGFCFNTMYFNSTIKNYVVYTICSGHGLPHTLLLIDFHSLKDVFIPRDRLAMTFLRWLESTTDTERWMRSSNPLMCELLPCHHQERRGHTHQCGDMV